MLAFLLDVAASTQFPKSNTSEIEEEISQDNAIYFDILVLNNCCKSFVNLLSYSNYS